MPCGRKGRQLRTYHHRQQDRSKELHVVLCCFCLYIYMFFIFCRNRQLACACVQDRRPLLKNPRSALSSTVQNRHGALKYATIVPRCRGASSRFTVPRCRHETQISGRPSVICQDDNTPSIHRAGHCTRTPPTRVQFARPSSR